GHSVFEHSWKVVTASLNYDDPSADDGNRVDTPARQYLVFKDFGIRLPRTIYQWHSEDGQLQSVTQRVWKDDTYVTVTIPVEDLLVFTYQRVGDDYTGTSI